MSDLLRDPIDFGTQLAEDERQRNVAAVRERAAPKQEKEMQMVDGREVWVWPEPNCEGCGNPIPEARLEATGALTCVECETVKEKRSKQRGC